MVKLCIVSSTVVLYVCFYVFAVLAYCLFSCLYMSHCDVQAHRPMPRLDVCRVDNTWLRPVDCWTASSEERWERCVNDVLTLVSCGSFFFCCKRVNIVNKIESRLSWQIWRRGQDMLRVLYILMKQNRIKALNEIDSWIWFDWEVLFVIDK